MMIKKVLFAAIIASVSGSCLANWVDDLSYINIKTSGKSNHSYTKSEPNLGLISASVGFQVPINENFSVIPEVQYAYNVSDKDNLAAANSAGSAGKIKQELNRFYGFNIKAQYNFTPEFYAYVQPQYIRYKIEESGSFADGSTVNSTHSETNLGYGGGAGYQFNPNLAANVGYTKVDGDYYDLGGWQLGIRYNF